MLKMLQLDTVADSATYTVANNVAESVAGECRRVREVDSSLQHHLFSGTFFVATLWTFFFRFQRITRSEFELVAQTLCSNGDQTEDLRYTRCSHDEGSKHSLSNEGYLSMIVLSAC